MEGRVAAVPDPRAGRRRLLVVLLFLAVLLLLPRLVETENKYSAARNSAPPDPAKAFRVQKLNFIWDKAQHRLPSQTRKDLYLELLKLDKDYLGAKHAKVDGKDPDGLQLKQVEKRLVKVLAAFNVDDILASLSGTKEGLEPDNGSKDGAGDAKPAFADQKLNKLWETARSAGFSLEELSALKEEFIHHQEKAERYKDLMAELSASASENSLNDIVSDDDFSVKSRELKSRFREIQTGLDELAKKVEGSAGESFSHQRVKALWQQAVKAGFSESELGSLKEELRHFDSRLKKLEYFRQELENSRVKTNKVGKDPSQSSDLRDSERHLEDYVKKVEKYGDYLRSKILHSEL